MQPQRHEVRVENDECERKAAAPSVAIKRVVVLRNYYILVFCAVRNHAHILETLSM